MKTTKTKKTSREKNEKPLLPDGDSEEQIALFRLLAYDIEKALRAAFPQFENCNKNGSQEWVPLTAAIVFPQQEVEIPNLDPHRDLKTFTQELLTKVLALHAIPQYLEPTFRQKALSDQDRSYPHVAQLYLRIAMRVVCDYMGIEIMDKETAEGLGYQVH